jgi:hypothetical protein
MIEVFTIPISKAQFRTLPPKDRAMVLVSGHILNQIGVLVKLVLFSTNNDLPDNVEGKASGCQSQILLRFLIAVLSEINTERPEFGSQTANAAANKRKLLRFPTPGKLRRLDGGAEGIRTDGHHGRWEISSY